MKAAQKWFWAGCLCLLLGSVQRLLSGGCSVFSVGTELMRSWFLISAYSERDRYLWRTRGLCGEERGAQKLQFVPHFLSPWYISSTDSAEDYCFSKRKTGGENLRVRNSRLRGVFFLPSLLSLCPVAAVQEGSTGTLSASQVCSGGEGSSSSRVSSSLSAGGFCKRVMICCAHV